MILAPLADAALYYGLNPLFQQAFNYIAATDFSGMAPGAYELAPGLTVMLNEPKMKTPEQARMEIHDEFIDIHVPLTKEEGFKWRDRATVCHPTEEFNREKDNQHFSDAPDTVFTVKPGQFAVFFPADAHAGVIGEGIIRKLVVKVKV